MRIFLLGGLVGPMLFATAVVWGGALRSDYDHTMQVMSALGGTGSPNAMLMNGLGFLPTGVLMIAFALALFRFVPRSFFSVAGTLFSCLLGVGIIAAGVYSCDPGCLGIGDSREAYLHIVASVIAFLSGILACFAWGFAFRADPEWRRLSGFSFVAALASGALLVAFNSTSGTDALPGIWQRLFIGSLFGWCAIVGFSGFRMMASTQTDAGQSGG